MEGDLRINPSSNLINAVQACILATKTAFQEAPLMGMCHTSTPEKKAAITTLNALQLLFWLYLCGEDL